VRRFVPIALLTLFALLACGGPAAAPDQAGSRVDTMFGPVDVPANPERVVALGWGDAEAALALGVQPVGASDWLAYGGEGVGPWAAGRYTTPPTVLGTKDLDIESVAALDPDLILWTRSDNDRTMFDTLRRIAPTVAPPPGVTTAYGTLYDQQTRSVAAALGRPADGEALVADVERHFADTRAAHPGWAGTQVAVGVYNNGNFAAYLRGGLRADFFSQLGFTLKPEIDQLPSQGFSADLGTESVSALDADLTVLFLLNAPGEAVRANPLVQRLGSTQRGDLVVLDDPEIGKALSSGTALSMAYAIDRAVPLLEATQV
jgi:iron complex transport system substrate-binding protein